MPFRLSAAVVRESTAQKSNLTSQAPSGALVKLNSPARCCCCCCCCAAVASFPQTAIAAKARRNDAGLAASVHIVGNAIRNICAYLDATLAAGHATCLRPPFHLFRLVCSSRYHQVGVAAGWNRHPARGHLISRRARVDGPRHAIVPRHG